MKTTALVAAVAALPAAAIAGDVHMRYTGHGAGHNVRLTVDGSSRDVFSGLLHHEIMSPGFLNGIYTTFCPDPTQTVAGDFANYTIENIEDLPILGGVSDPMGAVKANAIRALFGAEQQTLYAGGVSNAYGAAFQLAIWEIVVDFNGDTSSIDVTSGNMTATKTSGEALGTSTAVALADLRVSVAQALLADELAPNLIGLGSQTHQDQIVIPAPGAFALAGIGALVAARRRR